jgi:hypothetical protein
MKITFERSGGIAGLRIDATFNLDEMPADQAFILRGLVEAANFFMLPENPAVSSMPDEFQYTITIVSESREHTIHTSDASAAAELRPLLDDLSRRARTARR